MTLVIGGLWWVTERKIHFAEQEARSIVDPEGIDDPFGPTMFISRESLMTEIQSVNTKVEALVDHIATLIETTIND